MNKEMQTCDNIFSLIDDINTKNNFINTTSFDNANELAISFINIYRKEINKLPYHINIVDLLRANENAHSRIFAELLKQNSNNKYDILESFYDYLKRLNPDFDKKPINPKITSEKDRIDLLILDIDHAVIIENKIHYANDQPAQLARYIDKVKNQGIKENEIWVIYLTRYGNEPESQSWGDYKNSFSERFFSISFRNDILLWLKDSILPNCGIKDVYLKSTIEQYIDHLEGIFNLRKIQNKMNAELQNHIKQALGLTSHPERDYQKLNDKLKDLEKVKEYINEMLLSTEKECWQKWLNQLKMDFPNYETIYNPDDKDYPKTGIILEYKGKKIITLIEIETEKDDIYYGITKHDEDESQALDPEIKILLKPLLEGFDGLGDNEWWYGWKYASFENVYSQLKALIERIIFHIKENQSN